MSKSNLPSTHVQQSLLLAEKQLKLIAPLIVKSIEIAHREAHELPEGGAHHSLAESQAEPTIARLRLQQLIGGYNLSATTLGLPIIQSKHIRNVAICIGYGDAEYRLYRLNAKYKTRRTGKFQARLVDQVRYRNQVASRGVLPGMNPVPLNSLIYVKANRGVVEGFIVAIPDGFDDRDIVRLAAWKLVSGFEDLEEAANFRTGSSDESILGAHTEVLPAINEVNADDPHDVEDGPELVSEDVLLGQHSLFETSEESVLEPSSEPSAW